MKIKTYLFVCIIISHFSLLNAQNVGINDDGSTPNSNAILDIKTSSNDKGVLLPRLTSSQRTSFGSSLAASEQSMMVYDTDTKSYWYWNGTVWNEFLQNQSGWKINGNSGTNSASNFIGTTDAQDLILKSNNVVGLQIDNSSGYVGIGHNFNFGILAQLHIRTQGSTDATYAFGFQSGLGYVYYITDAGTVFHTGNYNLTGRFIQNGGLSRKAENTFSYIRHNTQSVPDTSEAGLAIS